MSHYELHCLILPPGTALSQGIKRDELSQHKGWYGSGRQLWATNSCRELSPALILAHGMICMISPWFNANAVGKGIAMQCPE